MAIRYTTKQIAAKLRKLAESFAESEEDQKKEKKSGAGKDAEEGAAEKAGAEEGAAPEIASMGDAIARCRELGADDVADFLEKNQGGEGGEEDGLDDFFNSDDEDDSGFDFEGSEDSEGSENSENSEGSEDSEEKKDEEKDEKKVEKKVEKKAEKKAEGKPKKGKDKDEISESAGKYKPNTVGAVIQLLEKFDPKSRLMIRMNPGKYVCMPIDVSARLRLDGRNCTYMDIAKGKPGPR